MIIDDVGDRLSDGRRAVALPAAVTLSFLPHSPYAARLARETHATGKEVMLHLPMDSVRARPLGPGGLTERMDREEFLATVRADIAAIPYLRGINNHMGSLMTTDGTRMMWLMEELRAYEGLYFVDSRTSGATVAGSVAVSYGIPSSRRDVFLDNDPRPEVITRQFRKLIAAARRNGSALGIGHPRPATLAVLEQELPTLTALGVQIVPVSKLIAFQQENQPQLWQASLSPSPSDVKNSKP